MGADVADRRHAEAEQLAQRSADEMRLDSGPDRLGALGRAGPRPASPSIETWMWASIRPGRTVRPATSMIRAPSGMPSPGAAIASIRPSRIRTVRGPPPAASRRAVAARDRQQSATDEASRPGSGRMSLRKARQPVGVHAGIVPAGAGATLPAR